MWCGDAQPRTCDIRLAEQKKEKNERKQKKQAERDRQDADIIELAQEKAVKRRKEIKDSEVQIAESKERFRKDRGKSLRKFEEVWMHVCMFE